MDHEFQDLEAALKNLRPERFSAAYMDRLTAAMEGRSQQADPALQQMERALAGMMPLAPSAGLSQRCLEIVAKVPFPVDEKVVLFPGKAQPAPKKATAPAASRTSWWMGAAAVAMAGAFSALFVGGGHTGPSSQQVVSNAPAAVANGGKNIDFAGYSTPAAPGNFVPASTNTGVEEAKDEGVVWNQQGNPVRMVRVVYIDTVKLLDKDGKIQEVRRPRVEYIAVPEKVD